MTLAKRLLASRGGRALLAWAVAGYIHLVRRTSRWQVRWPPEVEAMAEDGSPFLACFWHGRLMAVTAWYRGPRNIHIMISAHRDGLLISRALGHLGYATLSGSSRRGGATALRATQRLLDEGARVAITPDGPRGPRMRAKPGLIKAAQLSGAPIIPLAGAADRCRVLETWDRFCLILPFARGVILCGEPLRVPRDAEPEELARLNRHLEDRLNALSAEADRLCGRAAIEPSPRPPAPRPSGTERARA